MLSIADALMGNIPAIRPNATRTVSQAEPDEAHLTMLRNSISHARCTRSENVARRATALLRNHYTKRVFCHNHVIVERLDGHKLGRGPLRRVIESMVEDGELVVVHSVASHKYYAFASNHTPDLSEIDTRQRQEQKARRISSANLLRNWPQARKGFTHYQLMHLLNSDQYATHAISDLLATGEIVGTQKAYRNRAKHCTVYRLADSKETA